MGPVKGAPYWLATDIVSIPYNEVIVTDEEAKAKFGMPITLVPPSGTTGWRPPRAARQLFSYPDPEQNMAYLINGMTFAMMLFILASGA